MASEEDEDTCPLCLEVLDETDKSVQLCQCEYQVSARSHIFAVARASPQHR